MENILAACADRWPGVSLDYAKCTDLDFLPHVGDQAQLKAKAGCVALAGRCSCVKTLEELFTGNTALFSPVSSVWVLIGKITHPRVSLAGI